MVHFIFFRNKTFLFVKIEIRNFQHLFDFLFHEASQNFSSFRQTFRWHFSIDEKNCPNELKFCEVSWNKKSKRCWKFQISILTNKIFWFLKKRLRLDVLTFLIKGFGIFLQHCHSSAECIIYNVCVLYAISLDLTDL